MAVVLIAEDNVDVRQVLTRIFIRAGYTVRDAGDGRAALRIAREQRPDVVVTDLDMPGMTGLELCQAIRAETGLADVPVGILSGSLRPGDPRAADAGACAVWLKPFGTAELVDAVRALAETGPHPHRGDPPACPLAAAGRPTLSPVSG